MSSRGAARASPTNPRESLLGVSAQRVQLGALSARVAAALQRVAGGGIIDDIDAISLRDAESMIRSAAEALEFVETEGKGGTAPDAAAFNAVAVTLEAVATADIDATGALSYLGAIAEKLDRFLASPSRDLASALLPVFSSLAELAVRDAGSTGEVQVAF